MREEAPKSDASKAAADPLIVPLTKREREVLGLMAFGLSNKDIAVRLSLGRRTVETHIDHVLGKLNAPTRARAVVEAGRAGLLGGVTASNVAPEAVERPNNLPFQLTMLLGREQDLDKAKSLLAEHRLVTLSGSGGVGKTRLALRVGVDVLDLYSDGAWLCDFSPISDPLLVASAVARSLGLQQQPNGSLIGSVVRTLKRRRVLLVLDNCEHVVDAVAELVDEIMHKCPSVRVLATSRQALGIVGEVVYRVHSLATPETASGLTADEGMRYGAIALFVDRAQASNPSFICTDENAPVIAEICARLDGIPLAIELAATRSNVVNLKTLARSLDDRFNVLTAGGRTALPRHKTLARLIDWSYDLLAPQEKTLFDRAGIFAGGFTLAAATAVCRGAGLDEVDVFGLLASLTDKSLVVADTRGVQERFRMLESTRAYALDKLAAGGDRERMASRHAEFFRDHVVADNKPPARSVTYAWLDDAELDLDNYRAALEWSLHHGGDAVVGALLAGELWRLWYRGGLANEGGHWIETALARIDGCVGPRLAARLWCSLAELSVGKSATEAAEKAMDLYESAGDSSGVALALNARVKGLRHMGRVDEARECAAKALDAHRAFGDQSGAAVCLMQLGLMASARGDIADGRKLFAEALTIYKALGDDLGVAAGLTNLAELEFADRHPERALRSCDEALDIISGRRLNATSLALIHNNAALYRIAVGDLDGARASAGHGLTIARKTHFPLVVAIFMHDFSLLAVLSGRARNAARLLGFADRSFDALAYTREPTEMWGYEKLMAALREHLSEAEIGELAAEGAAWAEDRAIEEALKV